MAIAYRPMQPEEVTEVCKLVDEIFDQYNAPDYSAQGSAEFRKYNTPEAMMVRAGNGHFTLVAIENQRIIGAIEIRNHQHISLLYVASEFMGKGIARQLWKHAIERCREAGPTIREFTVYSSPYAIAVYRKLGFSQTSPEQVINGLRFIPMSLKF